MRELFARIWQRLNECAFDDLPVRETVLGLFLHQPPHPTPPHPTPPHPTPSEPSHCAARATALIVCVLSGVANGPPQNSSAPIHRSTVGPPGNRRSTRWSALTRNLRARGVCDRRNLLSALMEVCAAHCGTLHTTADQISRDCTPGP